MSYRPPEPSCQQNNSNQSIIVTKPCTVRTEIFHVQLVYGRYRVICEP